MDWSTATLAQDSDLTRYESRMPDLAKKIVGPSGKSCYDGKRDIAKHRIANLLRARNMDLDGLQAPTQLADAAALLELSLIFRDMAWRNDAVAAEKAAYYEQTFQEEMDGIALDYEEPDVSPDNNTRAYGHARIERG
jgi:hypothetical protein